MVPTLREGTQDTDFNKGFTTEMFIKNIRRRNGGGQGDPDPLSFKQQSLQGAIFLLQKKENKTIQY